MATNDPIGVPQVPRSEYSSGNPAPGSEDQTQGGTVHTLSRELNAEAGSAVVTDRQQQYNGKRERPASGRSKALPVRNLLILGVSVGVVAAVIAIAMNTGAGKSARTGTATSAAPNAVTPVNAASFSIRLPANSDRPTVGAQRPTFILSDFEESTGAWQPDKRLPSCRTARISRVRDRAQQGAYWLKMDRVKLDPEVPDAAFTVRPDTRDLSPRGTTLSAAVFVPIEARPPLTVRLAIQDSRGARHDQEEASNLVPGQWTLVSWNAGDLLTDAAQLVVTVHSPDHPYDGYIGLDNVSLRSDISPAISTIKAIITQEGFLRLGDGKSYLARIGLGVFGDEWQYATQTTSASIKALANGMESTGTVTVPDVPDGGIKYRLSAHAVYNREVIVNVEATPQSQVKLRSLGAEVLVPRSTFGSTTLDAAPTGSPASPTPPLIFATTTADVHLAGNSPFGMELRSQAPGVFMVLDDLVPVRFIMSSPKTLQSASLAGAFNHWNTNATPMKGSGDGRTWEVTVPMPPGEQQYKFVLNGNEWITDPRSTKDIKDRDGNTNSVKYVPRLSQETRSPAFHLVVTLAGGVNGAPVTLAANQTLKKSFRLILNQPFKNQMNAIDP